MQLLGAVFAVLSACATLACGSGMPSHSAQAPSQATLEAPAFTRQQTEGSGFRVDRHPQSICGTNDLQPVNTYIAKLGQDAAFVRMHKDPVGALADSDLPTSAKYCTGSLISADLFLTAGHCVDASTVGQFVAFHYETAPGSQTSLAQDVYKVAALTESGGSLDYAVLQLEGAPGLRWGWAAVRTTPGVAKEVLTIVQHPGGQAKQVDVGHADGTDGNYLKYADLDTEPGSSGSGVLDTEGYLIAVHTNGECTETGGYNSGVRLSAAGASAVLTRLAGQALPFGDGSAVAVRAGETLDATGGSDLNADFTGHGVSLSQAGAGTAAPSRWILADQHDGSFTLQATAADGRVAYLAGRSTDGTVSLRDDLDLTDYATKWRIKPTDDGRYLLRTVGGADGPRWLGAGKDTGVVVLNERAAYWHIDVR